MAVIVTTAVVTATNLTEYNALLTFIATHPPIQDWDTRVDDKKKLAITFTKTTTSVYA